MTTNLPSTQVNWESELKGAHMLVKSGLTPKDVRTPEAAMFIILAGRDLGLSPVQSLRSIRVIQGKVEASADLQLGLFHREGGKSKWLQIDTDQARLQLIAPWMSEPHVSAFSIEDAKRADLMSNPTWKKYPKAMLRSRAITQGLKDIGFLAGAGVYAPGEIGGAITIDAQTGEVIPGEQPEPILKGKDHTPLGGVVEALPDADRKALESIATAITTLVNAEDMPNALTAWEVLDNDDKVAVWAMLDKDIRKAIKAAKEPVNAVKAAEPQEDDATREVRKCIVSLQFDAARDLLRELPAAMQILMRTEIDKAEAAANVAEQP
jgi:hypothetical protein